MVKVMTITNEKGGVGKTATTVNLGKALETMGKKVLIIDCDPQGGVTNAYSIENPPYTTLDFLRGAPAETYESRGVSVIPSTKELAKYESKMAGEYKILKSALSQIKDKYDYVLIDTPPSKGLFTINAINASDSAICVCQTEYDSMKAIEDVSETIRTAQTNLKSSCVLDGLLLTMFTSNLALHKTIDKKIREAYKDIVFKTSIRRNVTVAECPALSTDVISYKPLSNGAVDYIAFAKEFLKRYES